MVMPGAGAVCYLDARRSGACSGGDPAAAASAVDPAPTPPRRRRRRGRPAAATTTDPAAAQPATDPAADHDAAGDDHAARADARPRRRDGADRGPDHARRPQRDAGAGDPAHAARRGGADRPAGRRNRRNDRRGHRRAAGRDPHPLPLHRVPRPARRSPARAPAYMGVVKGGGLASAATSQQVAVQEVVARRGSITDRHGAPLATSEPADDISATPYLVKDPVHAAAKIAPLLEPRREHRRQAARAPRHRLRLPRPPRCPRSPPTR